MDKNKKRKVKGGAEKVRLKKQKLLEASAQKCVKLTNVFACPQSHSSTSNAVEETVAAAEEVANSSYRDQEQQENDQKSEIEQQENDHKSEIEQQVDDQKSEIDQKHIKSDASDLAIIELQTEQDSNSIPSFNYFVRPEKSQLDLFFKYHPKQDVSDPVLKKAMYRKDGSNRKWLTYSDKQNALFCSVCLAFASPWVSSFPFLRGMEDRRHVHDRVDEHERSVSHHNCAEAYFLRDNKANLDNLLFCNQMSLHRAQVRKRREILQRIIDIIKFIGKRGLSYRGDKLEAAYTLEDMSVDHGNFLELVVLLSKYDITLKDHLKDCIESSKKLHESQKSKGRGSLLTFLSKSTINKIIQSIGQLITRNISMEVQAAGMFSLQVDTTQDISCKDQCSIIVRYVKDDRVYERLLAVVECKSSTGQNMFSLVDSVLKSCNIDITKCIGNSTDGAANMQGEYKGFSSWLSKESPGQIHVWCYAHVLNLVLGDTTKALIESASFFSLLNSVAVFFRESYQRMNIWEQSNEHGNKKRLATIGETRWWSKDSALKKIFGSFSNSDSTIKPLYVTLITSLETIQQNSNFKPDIRAKAKIFLESFCKYETVITAKIFSRIFELTTPLSQYLQTSGLDILKAFGMVSQTCSELKKIVRDFEGVQKVTDDFIIRANKEFEETETEIEIQTKFPQKRLKKRKLMPGETASNETVFDDETTAFKINVHNIIFSTVVASMERRFPANGKLYADFSYLDPKRFPEIRLNKLQSGELNELSKLLLKFDETAIGENLRIELRNLALHWEKLKNSDLEDYKIIREDHSNEDNNDFTLETEEEVSLKCETRSACKNCVICCYKILQRFNLLTNSYNLIGLALKFLLTLSISQVACERSFSTLKVIKNRMRSTLSSDNLNALMVMAIEKDLLMKLDSDDIIDKVAENSELLQKSLN